MLSEQQRYGTERSPGHHMDEARAALHHDTTLVAWCRLSLNPSLSTLLAYHTTVPHLRSGPQVSQGRILFTAVPLYEVITSVPTRLSHSTQFIPALAPLLTLHTLVFPTHGMSLLSI